MNDLAPHTKPKISGEWFIFGGMIVGCLPFLCFWIISLTAGHELQGSFESAFFYFVFLGTFSIPIAVPLGLILIIIGLVKMFRRR